MTKWMSRTIGKPLLLGQNNSQAADMRKNAGKLSFFHLAHFAPMSVGVEAIISYGDLTLVGNMGGDPGDKLQVIHPLHLFRLFPIPVADFPLPF